MDNASFIPELPEAVTGAPSAIAAMYATTIVHNSPVVKAALALAQESYARQENRYRGTKVGDVKIPSITHPIMVVKLIQKIGVDDPLTLATALLHDVLEDDRSYQDAAAEMMRTHLQEKLEQQGIPTKNASEIARLLYGYCLELRNSKQIIEGKRSFQARKILNASDRSRLVKIADQTASLVVDIWFRHQEHDPIRLRGFAYKGLDVVTSAASRPAIAAEDDMYQRQAAGLYRIVCDHLLAVLAADTPEQEHLLRNQFTVEGALRSAQPLVKKELQAQIEGLERRLKKMDGQSESASREYVIYHPAYLARNEAGERDTSTMPKMGCLCIQLDDNEHVTAYDLVARSELDPKGHADAYLKSEIEIDTSSSHVATQGRKLIGQTLVRHYTIMPPLPLKDFMERAKNASILMNQKLSTSGAEKGTGPAPLNIIDKRMTCVLEPHAQAASSPLLPR